MLSFTYLLNSREIPFKRLSVTTALSISSAIAKSPAKILEQAKQGRVLAYKFQGSRYDCGSVDGYVKATMAFYEQFQ